MKDFIAKNWPSWVIELTILGIVGMVTISEVRKTNEQTREMLTAISDFAGERKEGIANAVDSIASEAQNIEIDGKVDVSEITLDDVKSIFRGTNEEDEEE